jgi:hypothetical protein
LKESHNNLREWRADPGDLGQLHRRFGSLPGCRELGDLSGEAVRHLPLELRVRHLAVEALDRHSSLEVIQACLDLVDFLLGHRPLRCIGMCSVFSPPRLGFPASTIGP